MQINSVASACFVVYSMQLQSDVTSSVCVCAGKMESLFLFKSSLLVSSPLIFSRRRYKGWGQTTVLKKFFGRSLTLSLHPYQRTPAKVQIRILHAKSIHEHENWQTTTGNYYLISVLRVSIEPWRVGKTRVYLLRADVEAHVESRLQNSSHDPKHAQCKQREGRSLWKNSWNHACVLDKFHNESLLSAAQLWCVILHTIVSTKYRILMG